VSVGQARRIGVARALLADPAILLLDEPTAALDGTREAEVGATVAELARAGRTVVVVTHRQALVDLADDVVELQPAESGVPA
jgi:ATP-binding cassette subfamily C protein CydCD